MRETQILCAQNIGRLIKQNWFARGKIKIVKTSAEEILKDRGYEVTDIKEFLNPPRKREKINFIGLYDKELPKNEHHPDYKLEPCLIYKDNSVVIQGLEQAKVLTNTVEISEGLPDSVVESERKLKLPDEVHSEVIKKIKLSCIYEATQEKLPKRKDPQRPAWTFPREYGINDSRKNELLCKNLAVVCEQHAENIRNKSVILDAFFSTPVRAHNKLIQFEVTGNLTVTTKKKLKKIAEPSATHNIALPDLYPLHCTISLNPYHFYVLQDIYPLGDQSMWPYVQTAFIHLNPSQVKNVTEEEVTENQIHARSLLQGFSIAAAEARAFFGADVKKLPEPIVVPVVQTDGRLFHFTVFQLNTLELDTNSQEKNIFWNSPRIPLYLNCGYQKGRPFLEDYNEEVIRKLLTFYNLE